MAHDPAFEALMGKTGVRMDSAFTAAFEQQLEALLANITEAEFPELKALRYVPLEGGVDAGAETVAWRYFDRVGLAKLIANYATDLPNINEYGKKYITPIESVGAAFHYSLTDLRRAAMANHPLEARLGRIAREAIDRVIDKLVAHGDSATGIPGFLNHTGVPILNTGLNGDWDNTSTSAADILEDLMIMAFEVWSQSSQIHGSGGLTMLLGTNSYKAAASKIYSEYTGESALSVFMKAQNLVTVVESWTELDLADAQGDGERAVVYERNPENLSCIIPVRFETLPAQAISLHYSVPCHARVGGTIVRRPLSMVYVDTLLDT